MSTLTNKSIVPIAAPALGGAMPGLNHKRLLRLMAEAIERCRLDLTGLTVLTEAASGAYIVTPVLAAMAGANRVHAITRDTRYGSAQSIATATFGLAEAAGCRAAINIETALTGRIIGAADIVTNAGHVRPINSAFVMRMKPSAVVALMYEAWEYRSADVDLSACRERGIRVAGTNERISAVDVFSYLGVMALKLLLEAGVAVYGSKVMLLCDNPFGPFMVERLIAAGATVTRSTTLRAAVDERAFDVILVALTPTERPVLDAADARLIAERWPGVIVAQFWGDVDRGALTEARVEHCPKDAPRAGHMAILPSAIGAEPIVRLQSGGLKVGEVLHRFGRTGDRVDWEFVDEM